MLSVICPVYNEIKYIDVCIQSVLAQDFPKDDLEVLFVDGMSTDGTRDVIRRYAGQYAFIRLVDNPDRIVPKAMNRGIELAQGDVLMRLDAHALYPKDYFSTLVRRLKELGADNVGVACRTDVLHKNRKTLAIREVLSNRFGVGNSTFRLGTDKVCDVDTVPFGCWPRSVFDRYGRYDVRLIRNQDIELNKRIIRGGGRICLVPDTSCTYLARETYRGIARNNYLNGKWNILTVFYTKEANALSLRHFVPLAFLLSLILPVLCAFFYLPLIWVAVASLAVYLATLSVVCCRLAVRKGLNFFSLLTAFVVLHFSYGWGSLVALLTLPFLRRDRI